VESQALEALQAWYAAQCDGDWETRYGVMLATSETSGWELRVDLAGTELEGRELGRVRAVRTPDDWFEAWCDGYTFRAAGGADSLDQILVAFFDFSQLVEAY
jgi:Immunity protein 53